MKEIEILYPYLEDIAVGEQKVNNFKKDVFVLREQSRVVDTYFVSNFFNDLSPSENYKLSSSLRVREINEIGYITYKLDKFNDKNIWLYSDEYETMVDSATTVKGILENLHFSELVKIDNTKTIYENSQFELVFEDVKGLGNFLEIEYKSNSEIEESDIENIKESIRSLANELHLCIGEELNAGKPELMLKKNVEAK